MKTGRFGIYHVTNSGPTTWFEFVKEIFHLSGISTEVVPVTSEQFPRPAKRPLNSVLDPFPIKEVLGEGLPSWKEALEEYLSQRKERARL
jgi:dTDP-4-dehydrorhamnose reductase